MTAYNVSQAPKCLFNIIGRRSNLILILDEATSALDSITERNIQKSLDELSEGRTTLVVAHRLTTIRKADVIIVITKEGIAEMGNHEELMNMKGIYYKLNQA